MWNRAPWWTYIAFVLLLLSWTGGARAEPSAPRVVTPNGSSLPLHKRGGVKVGHLIAEELTHELAPGLKVKAWGYNGSTPGPTIEATQGDRLRIYVTNKLPAPTTVHWHGLVLPSGMDGVSGLSQPPIPVGKTFVYEFDLKHAGTFMYHPHHDEMTQLAMGMAGMFIVHPKTPVGPRVDRDFVLMTHEWKVRVGAARPDPNEMSDFNVFTLNGKSYPATDPLVVKRGERVRIRIGNLSPTDHHPIHVHGLWFHTTATDGGFIPLSAQIPETTVLVPVGTTRVIELVATEVGDWAIHCHMTHHTMTQMGHGTTPMVGAKTAKVGAQLSKVVPGGMVMGTTGMGGMSEMNMRLPNNSAPMLAGKGGFGSIDMGGMFTVLKVRDDPTQGAAGWYRSPPRELAGLADPQQMQADGIGGKPLPTPGPLAKPVKATSKPATKPPASKRSAPAAKPHRGHHHHQHK